MKKNQYSIYQYVAIVCIIIGLFILAIFSFRFDILYSGTIDTQLNADIGNFIGGIVGTLFSLGSLILIYATFSQQSEINRNQNIESRFFELMKLHSDNLKDINYRNSILKEELTGRKAIDFIFKQFNVCFTEIKPFFNSKECEHVYTVDYLKQAKKMSVLRNMDIVQLAHIDISYSIIFYGTSEEDIVTLRNLLQNKYKDEFITHILDFIKVKPLNKKKQAVWQTIVVDHDTDFKIQNFIKYCKDTNSPSLTDLDNNTAVAMKLIKAKSNWKYYGGHQYKLGHYFRHLFQTVKYIDEQRILTYKEKYNYLKILRAQLSTVEQYLLFVNSLSFMGRSWELDHLDTKKETSNNWLITKYNFIKNIPNSNLNSINVLDYYPDIHFEFSKSPNNRKELVQKFR